MPTNVPIHYDNSQAFADPHLRVWYDGSDVSDDFAKTSQDASGGLAVVQPGWSPASTRTGSETSPPTRSSVATPEARATTAPPERRSAGELTGSGSCQEPSRSSTAGSYRYTA